MILAKAFFNKEIGFCLIRICFGEHCEPLQYVFTLFFEKSIFPNDLKIAKITPIFKAGDNTELSNYRPISALPCFSKILERVMTLNLPCNSITCRTNTQQFPVKQLYFRFIYLSKSFDTVDHNILHKKLEINKIVGKSLQWFQNYFNNRKQCIEINKEEKTNLPSVKCGLLQESIQEPLLFVISINELSLLSDTNLFYSHKDINIFFLKVNNQRHKINDLFLIIFLHKRGKKDDIPLLLPKLKRNNYGIKREINNFLLYFLMYLIS